MKLPYLDFYGLSCCHNMRWIQRNFYLHLQPVTKFGKAWLWMMANPPTSQNWKKTCSQNWNKNLLSTTTSVIFLPHKFCQFFFTNKIRKELEFSSLFSGVILTNIFIFGKPCKKIYVRKKEKEKRKAQLGFHCVIMPLGYYK